MPLQSVLRASERMFVVSNAGDVISDRNLWSQASYHVFSVETRSSAPETPAMIWTVMT